MTIRLHRTSLRLTVAGLAKTGLNTGSPLEGAGATVSASDLVEHGRANIRGGLGEDARALVYSH